MSSTIEVRRLCEYCGGEFVAKTTKTRYCSRQCNSRAYKKNKRLEMVASSNIAVEKVVNAPLSLEHLLKKEFLTISETAQLLSVTRQTIYNWLNTGVLMGKRISNRKVLIYRQYLVDLFESRQAYERPKHKEKTTITEFYTIAEVEEIYGIKYRRLHDVVKKHHIPNTLKVGVLYVSRTHLDSYFDKQINDVNKISEWYTVLEIIEKYGITRDAIYGRVKENNIPKKTEGRYVKISKKHFDELFEVEL
ncbi:MAG: helix-turn-helix domain-containing protein [Bacteroidales bacterium]|jgi:excisionase family DNA binding protein|nr:helix-turn-helix domain-containing protein [Bacteroidales bacterium]